MEKLRSRLAEVDAQISSAALDFGRDPREITRIVVTKFHPVEMVHDLANLGVRDVGENRQQELTAKAVALDDPEVRWHFVGQAQTNKAVSLRRVASVVHTVDRPRLAHALHRAAVDDRPLDVLIQINLTRDAARGGVAPDEAAPLAELVNNLDTLRLRGVMAVAPLDEEPASAFERLAAYADTVRTVAPDATWLSAGMSGDFREAIAIGATHLRIGSAITGPRPIAG